MDLDLNLLGVYKYFGRYNIASFYGRKCIKYRCIAQTTTWPQSWGPFSSARKLLSARYCNDLAVLVLKDLLDSRPRVHGGKDIQFY